MAGRLRQGTRIFRIDVANAWNGEWKLMDEFIQDKVDGGP